eukprot:12628185-Alexandrium_andersonii.AAC.1
MAARDRRGGEPWCTWPRCWIHLGRSLRRASGEPTEKWLKATDCDLASGITASQSTQFSH